MTETSGQNNPEAKANSETNGGEKGEPKRLYRSRTNKVIGGVAGGLGDYLEIDPVIIRIAWVLLAILGGAGVLAYIVALIVVPEEPKSKTEPAAPENTSSKVSDTADVSRHLGLIVGAVLVG
ncbi:MAG: PspC domain-containing protein, partial [Rubrobacteridae bacterium]|nr:PspC domain-containing protein [Rubrobacteridae bacterium]